MLVSRDQKIHGLDPMYFDRRRSLESALKWSGVDAEPRFIVDVGANIGQTLEAFLGWWPRAHCVSVEPNPEIFHELEEAAKRIGNRAQAINVGLSSGSGSLVLQVSKVDSKTASFNRFNKKADTLKSHRGLSGFINPWELGDEDNKFISNDVIALDELISSRLNVEAKVVMSDIGIDLIKIDTEMWELEVLRGATKALDNTRVLLLEWHFDDVYGQPPPIHELDKILSDAGFRFWDISHIYKDLNTMRTLWVDLIYAKPAG